jgi:transposase
MKKIKETMKLCKTKTISLVIAVANRLLNEIEFVKTIDENTTFSKEHRLLSPGQCAKAFVLATMTDIRVPLTHLHERTEDMDLEYLLGTDYNRCGINAFNMGRALDDISEKNVNHIYESLAMTALKKYKIPIASTHSDTTTISFYGEYDIDKLDLSDEEKSEILKIEKGYNKDGRPGDKQLVVGQIVTDTGIPLASRALDGATSDVEWNKLAIECYRDLQTNGLESSPYVADCKLVTQELVETMNMPDSWVPFVSRCPSNFNNSQANRAKRQAYAANNWVEYGQVSSGKSANSYRKFSYAETIFGTPMRLLVLESSSLCEKAKKAFIKQQNALEPLVKAIEKKQFACYADAKAEFDSFAKSNALVRFDCAAEIIEKSFEKWPPGRRSATTKPTITSIFHIKVTISTNQEAYDEFIQNKSSFVLISNILEDSMSDLDLLKLYKGQHTVETSFRHLKNPQLASVIYLKNPKRVEALFMLLSFSLLVRAIIQYRLKDGLKQHLEENPYEAIYAGWSGRKLISPTFQLFYMHTKNCRFEREGNSDYSFNWPNVETRAVVVPLLKLLGLTISTILM